MSDLIAKLRLQAADEGLTSTATKAAGAVDQVGKAASGAKTQLDQTSASARSAEANLRQLESGAGRVSGAMEGLGAAIGLVGLKELAAHVSDAAFAWQGYETGLTAVTGSHANAAATIAYVRDESARLGLSLKDQLQSFVGLASATHNTALQGEETRQIWLGLNEAGAAQHLTADKMSRAMEALNQIAGKGVVSMQDLRQQLAQDLPGAAEVAQRAMGLTGAEFNKLVSTGQLMAHDFLPKFAAQLEKEYGPALEGALVTPVGHARVAIADLKTDMFDLQTVAGQGFLAGAAEGVTGLNSALTKGGTIEAARELGYELGQVASVGAAGVSLLAEHAQQIVTVMTVLGGLKVAAMIGGWGAAAVEAAGEVGVFEASVAALGGPIGIVTALVGGGLALGMAAYGKASADAAAQQAVLAQHSADAANALQDAQKWLGEAATATGGLGDQAKDANKWVEELTGKVGALADQLFRVAAANKERLINEQLSSAAGLQASLADLQARKAALSGSGPNFDETGASSFFNGDTAQSLDPQIADVQAQLTKSNAATLALSAKSTVSYYDQPAAQAGLPKTNKGDNRAIKENIDLGQQIKAQQDYTAAILAGGKALDDWKVKDAGRQALEKTGLAERPKLTAAEQTLADSIRTQAEQVERLKIDNDRLAQAAQLKDQADRDTKALKDQAIAYMAGEQAAEDFQVKEAGLQVLQQLHVETLDQLTGKTREETEAAIASAEAKERQALATQKAQKVAGELQDLDRQITAEKAHTASLLAGTKAETDYARAEFERQEIERAGTNLTADQIAQIKAKADLLFSLQGKTALADDAKTAAEDLKTAGMTADEREREARALQLSALYLQSNKSLTQAQADAMAMSQAAEEQLERQRQTDLGQLRDGLRQTFIDSGKLGFDQIGDYATKRLRQAVYDALLAKPIDMVINAVVGSVTGNVVNGALGLGQSAGGATSALGSLISPSQMAAISSVAAPIAMAYAVSQLSSGASGALARALGMGSDQQSAAKSWGQLGILPGLIAGLLTGQSNHTAAAYFDASGGYRLGGDNPNADTTKAATTIGDTVQQAVAALKAIGIDAGSVIQAVETGARDSSKVVLNSGQTIYTAKGDAQALTDAITHALLQNAHYQDPSLKGLVDQMLAANKSFDDISTALQTASDALEQLRQEGQSTNLSSAEQNLILSGASNAAAMIVAGRTFGSNIDAAMLQFTDPTAYAKAQATAQIDAQYAANKAQAQDLISAGLASADVLTKLDQLHTLQVADALNALTGSATDASGALAEVKPKLQAWLDGLDVGSTSTLNPDQQRTSALAAYQRELGQAQGGDADALGDITTYADRLLQADQQATSSAAARAALEAQVKAQIASLGGLSLDAVTSTSGTTVAESVNAGSAAGASNASVVDALQRMQGALSDKLAAIQAAVSDMAVNTRTGLGGVASEVAGAVGLLGQINNGQAMLTQQLRASTLR